MKLSKVYEPDKYERDIYALWLKTGSFEPNQSRDTFTVVMPPPNANAPLHIGHALTVAVEDTMIRFNRLQGKAALYLPGADHAGFETWVVYEKQLNKQGKARFDFTREELFDQVWSFVEENKGTMLEQTKALGASVDWNRFTYTLDEKIVKTAYQTFKKMWDDDLIYRGERIVNYCTVHDTSFADIEVEYIEHTDKLWHIEYPLTDGSGSVTVATTRLETMLGDTAVAVHPEDKKYKKMIGKTAKLPLTDREIPIVADEAVEQEFGTGAVKVTPAHDPTDFEIGERHDLPAISVIGFDGKLTAHVPEKYIGLSVEAGRQAVLADLKSGKHLVKEEELTHSVGHCYKCGSVIEPLLKDQWFIRVEPLAKPALKALKAGEIDFYPESRKSMLIDYLENLKDWNISRQIAWGIPIPAFRSVDEPSEWIFDERVNQELIHVDGKAYTRDPDVFDTWFSSGQWPFATLGYPDDKDFKRFYPTSMMETGYDILFPWVSRMIMLGLYVTGTVPFKQVYLHGLITDPDGQKMSKSKGNVVNPMEMLEKYGSDALRMGLLHGRSPGLNQAFDESKVIGARNFANKLWNISRYIEGILGDDFRPEEPKPKFAADEWMLHRLSAETQVITGLMAEYRFSEAYERLYALIWDDFADWYVEVSKVQLNRPLLAHLLEQLLILVHPLAPFVSETIWQTLTWTEGELITADWPKEDKTKYDSEEFNTIKAVVTEIRDLKTRLHLRESTLYHQGNPFIDDNRDLIIKLTNIADVRQVKSGQGLHLTQSVDDAWLDVEHNVLRDYLDKLETELTDLENDIKMLENRLANKQYVKNAPKKLVGDSKAQLKDKKAQQERLKQQINSAQTSLRK